MVETKYSVKLSDDSFEITVNEESNQIILDLPYRWRTKDEAIAFYQSIIDELKKFKV